MKLQTFTLKHFKTFYRLTGALTLASILFAQQSQAQSSLSVSINAPDDDMEEYVSSALIDPGSSDLEMTTEGGGPQLIGLRFNNIGLPKGAVIHKAYIQFGADEANTETTNLTIQAQAADNPGTFTTSNKVSGRALLGESVQWNNIPAWGVDDYSVAQQTPDLKNLVQTLVNRTGWAKNNSMVFIIKGSGKRVADAFDEAGASTKPAKLVVEYFVPVTIKTSIALETDDMEEYISGTIGTSDITSSDLEMVTEGGGQQIIGLRFSNIGLTKGTVIQHAAITFGPDESNAEPTNLVIKAQAADSAATFVGNTKLVSSRPVYLDSVKWDNVPAWVANTRDDGQQTPNLAALVQLIVNRNGWKKNNAMAFILSGTGKRVADAFNEGAQGPNTKYAELTITYLGNDEGVVPPKPTYAIGTFPLLKGASWKYDASGTDRSSEAWTARSYPKDSSWAFANSKFGYGVNGVVTTIDTSAAKHTAYYFRNTFKAPAATADYDSLIFFAHVNDGIVVYLNGVEVKRINMPAGAVHASTFASSDLNQTVRFVLKNTLLANDTNSIAVEVHSFASSHTNLSFDLEVIGKLPIPAISNFPIKKNAVWSAYDQGKDLGTAWKTSAYSTSDWVHGAGVLGYGDPVTTSLWYGDNSTNKFPTVYLRKTIQITDISKLSDSLALNMRVDDGAVVYVNGIEVLRVNMPAGTIAYTTLANKAPVSETDYYAYKISKKHFTNGNNVVAVEVHQDGLSSSDLTFDLELKTIPLPPVAASGCNGPTDEHISCFTSVLPIRNQLLNIPTATHSMQILVQSGYPYNAGAAGVVSTNNDFTGFIPENKTSSTKGHLSINHETGVGAVSMLDLHYDAPSKLWMVDSAQGIDFSAVAGTNRNCSGGVTPWGTVITSEETRTAVDGNGDGYYDHGWNVEIDPRTNKIPSYGTGKQQKLWAVGRANHENVVVANDSLTLYWGEDAGDGHVYKFIADQKMNMYTGKLYALKLNSGLVSNEPSASEGTWILVPNTTQSDQNNTYSIAKSLGATQFNGVEDVEIHPLSGKIYFAAKGNSRTYRFKDNGNTVTEFETFVGGSNYTYIGNNGQAVTEDWGTGNDNLVFDDRGNLYVQQDGSKDHIWMVRNDHTQENPKVELFATTPEGSEPTGMTFSPDYKYAFISMQNPSASNTQTLVDAAGKTITFNKSTTLIISRVKNLANPITTDVEEELNTLSTKILVYPNPSPGTINIQFALTRTGVVTLEIFNMSGALVHKKTNTYDVGQHLTQLKLSTGMYVLKVTTENAITTEKIIIE